MRTLAFELRVAVRLLWKDKAFKATAFITLAVCLAANAALFSVVRGVLLKPLAIADSDRVVTAGNVYPGAGVHDPIGAAGPDLFDRIREVPALASQALVRDVGGVIEHEGTPTPVNRMAVTPLFFDVMGVQPLVGRTFTPDEAERGRERKVVLSYAFWRGQFGGDAGVTGRDLRVDGIPHTIVGVMPRDFRPIDSEIMLWTPLAFTPEETSDDARHSNNALYVARLAPGASVEQAQAQIDVLNAANLQRFPQFTEILKNARFRTVVRGLQESMVEDVRSALYLLWGGALFVLLIGWVNVANIVLVRSRARLKELATRLALGAGIWRIVRQLAIPALAALPSNLVAVLRGEGRTGTSGRGARAVRRALVVAQVASAFVLLMGAGVLLASFRRVLSLNPGFSTERVLTASVALPESRYTDAAALRRFTERVLRQLRAIPGVAAAGATDSLPFGNSASATAILAEGYQMKPGESFLAPSYVRASDGYFEALGLPIVAGRFFEARDSGTSPTVAIIDQRLARRFWPGRDPIGRRLYKPSDGSDLTAITAKTQFFTVVGVVGEVKMRDLTDGDNLVGAQYYPLAQQPQNGLTFVVKTTGDPLSASAAVRRELSALDAQLPVVDLQPMAVWVARSLASRRGPALLSLGFGGIALFLSAVGLYGVLAYVVTQRTREIGIRVALGSTRSAVFQLVLREGLLLTGVGLLAGGGGYALVRQALDSQLFGVTSADPLALALAGVLLGLVAVTACAIPALRATRIDPLVTLAE